MQSSLNAAVTELKKRLAELAPALDEAKRIEAAIAALEGKAQSRTGGARQWDGRRLKSYGRLSAGEEALLALMRERPGLTAAEMRAKAGMPKHTAYRYLRLLLEKGLAERRPSPSGASGHFAIPRPAQPERAPGSTREGTNGGQP